MEGCGASVHNCSVSGNAEKHTPQGSRRSSFPWRGRRRFGPGVPQLLFIPTLSNPGSRKWRWAVNPLSPHWQRLP
jgi:hypothetical protein